LCVLSGSIIVSVLQVCCSATIFISGLQRDAMCCSVVQCGAVWCSVVQCVQCDNFHHNVLQCVARCLLRVFSGASIISVLQRVAVYCHCVAVCCKVPIACYLCFNFHMYLSICVCFSASLFQYTYILVCLQMCPCLSDSIYSHMGWLQLVRSIKL